MENPLNVPASPDEASEPLTPSDHVLYWRAVTATVEQIVTEINELQKGLGEPGRPLLRPQRAVIGHRHAGDRVLYQFYLPDLRVAGEGRCVCEAASEALYQLQSLLDSVSEHKDWSILPRPDRSLAATVGVIKTNLYFRLQQFLNDRIPIGDAGAAREATEALQFLRAVPA